MLVLRHIAICATIGLWATWFGWLHSGTLYAQQPPAPHLSAISPLGIAPAKVTEMQLFGENLGQAKFVWTNTDAKDQISAKTISGNAASASLNFSAETPVGIYGLRLLTATGISNMRLFLIDDLPTVTMVGRNHTLATAMKLKLPIAVEGACEKESSHYFSFSAVAQESLSLEVFSRRLASPLDPVLRILNSEGKELAYADDEPGLMGDCSLSFTAPKTDTYLVELRDIRYKGDKEFRFRLRVGSFPLASICFPPVVQKGTKVEVLASVAAGPAVAPVQITVPKEFVDQEFKFGMKYSGEESGAKQISEAISHSGSSLLKVHSSELKQTFEHEPNNEPPVATALHLPHGVSGRFQRAEDQDWYHFSADEGDQLRIKASSKRFGSPAEVSLRVFAADRKLLTQSDPSAGEEPELKFTIPSSGTYQVLAENLQPQGGETYVYHLTLEKSSPGFSLKLTQSNVNLPERGVFTLPVIAKRTHYQGSISLHLPDLPQGCELSNAVITAGKNETTLQVQLPASQPQGSLLFSRVVGMNIDGKRTASVTANLLDPVRAELRWNAWPSADLTQELVIGVGPAFPEFLKLTMEPATFLLPQLVGTSSIHVKAERLHGFQEAVLLELNGLPSELKAKSMTIEKGQKELNIELSGGEKLPVGDIPFELTTRVTLLGQPQRVQLKGVIQVIPPLRVTLSMSEALTLEGKQKLKIKVERYGKENHPVKITLENLPEGVTAPEEIIIPAGVNTKEIELVAALTVRTGKFPNLQAKAVTKFATAEVTAISSPVTLNIVEEEEAGNGK